MTRASHQLDTLQEMLMFRRPAGTRTEKKFIARYIEPLAVNRDKAGNLIKRIGNAPVLWSCHTDTVHRIGGIQPVERKGDSFLVCDKQSNCLGADDTAGVFLMCEMARAKIPGLYVFHRGEEIGGVGSRWLAAETPELFDGIKYAIALDRKGTTDVITHQFGRCCSDEFAASLAAGLNAGGLHYRKDSSGIFTDTANYTHLIGECTNLSVGYHGQHCASETQDGTHALALLEALAALDHGTLVEVRKAGDSDSDDWGGYGYGNAVSRNGTFRDDWPGGWNDLAVQTPKSLVKLVRDYPDEVADLLDLYGVDEKEVWEHIKAARWGY